jgi:hypothetical protein
VPFLRWGFVTHGCIDGYSRIITFLGCGLTNESQAVLRLFVSAATEYGLPSRVRSDHGYENIEVAFLMNTLRGNHRGSHITGRSVHNQRIERLWRDVHKEVTGPLYIQFYELEDAGLLSPDNIVHIHVLQLLYLSEINKRLTTFRLAWNGHRMRSVRNRTPQQVWLDGMLENQNSDHVSTNEVFQERQSVLQRLEQRLGDYGIESVNVHDVASAHSPTVSSLRFNDVQNLRLDAALAAVHNNWRDRYTACVNAVRVDN